MREGTRLTHFKGGKYRYFAQGKDSETLEEKAIYQSREDNQIWIRPLPMFKGKVEKDGELVDRYEAEDTSHLIGEWSDTLHAFWYGANGCEFISFYGSQDIFVYSQYPNPPIEVWHYNKRIESLEDFSDALHNSTKYITKYTKIPDVEKRYSDTLVKPCIGKGK